MRCYGVAIAGLIGGLALAVSAAQAQSLPEGVRWGMSAQDLRAALPAVQPVVRPQRLSGGLVGAWSGAPVSVGGVALAPVFYFSADHLRRVEYSAQTDAQSGEHAFDALIAWGRRSFGPEQASAGGEGRYAAWMQGDLDIYAQRVDRREGASVRLVYALHERKDDSVL